MTEHVTSIEPAGDDSIQEQRPSRRRGALVLLRDVVVIVLVAVLVSFLVKTFVVRSFYIPSGSMRATLEVQDRILVDQITPPFSGYARGDVVVFRDPGGWLPPRADEERPPLVEAWEWVMSLVGLAAPDSEEHLIKRIIGLPGDHVECCNALGQIMINGTPIDESSYLLLPPDAPASAIDFDVTVPDDALWVLGDNRNQSKDSRYSQDLPGHGFVPLDNVVGRAFLITWPFNRFGGIDFHHQVFAGVPDADGDAVEPGGDGGDAE